MRTNLVGSLMEKLQNYLTSGANAKQVEAVNLLKARIMEELARPTHIAVIGKCGVGKTSTINSLFGFNGKVSHTRAATKQIQDYVYETEHGRLRISDLPGLGEDLDTEEDYRAMYVEVLKGCEVALFVLRADSRDMMDVQRIFREIVNPTIPEATKKIVIGLNQVDLVHPCDWLEEANLPSKAQEKTIQVIARERLKSLRKVCPLKPKQLVPYSAKKRYHLEHLFYSLMTCTSGEAWILDAKKQIANWEELVNAKYLVRSVEAE
ncbi:MAG: GTPase family protein [Thermoanaerobaculia bacterium]